MVSIRGVSSGLDWRYANEDGARTLWRWCGGNAHGGPVLQYELSTNLSNTLAFDDDELQCIED